MIIRYISFGIIHLIFYLLGFIFYPIIYPFRDYVRKNKTPFLWWFLNDTKDGDYGWYPHNFIGAFKWSVIRNSHWNLRLKISPKKGKIENVKVYYNTTQYDGMMFCNYTIHGEQLATYYVQDSKYFRYSFTKVYFNKILWNVQLGNNDVRFIYKSKVKLV